MSRVSNRGLDAVFSRKGVGRDVTHRRQNKPLHGQSLPATDVAQVSACPAQRAPRTPAEPLLRRTQERQDETPTS